MDDFSRKVWVYFLKKRSEVFEWFKERKTLVEHESGKKVKSLRIDNGLEFCSHEFSNYCKQVGIVRRRACSETPQQNGIIERINKTILGNVRCLLKDSGLPKKFWVEAIATACYQINRSPASSINFKTLKNL